MNILANTKKISREEWLEIRRNGIGGSDAATILGINKWKSRFELYIEKTEGYEEKDSETMYWGNILEEVVASEFENRTGKKVRRNNRVLQSKSFPWMIANLDREVVGEKAILECKTTSAYNYKEWQEDEIPANYIIQVQHYMAVTGMKKAYIAVLIGGQRFIWKEINRDETLIDILIQEESRFWNNHILKKIPPEIDGSTTASKFLHHRYPQSIQGKSIELKSENEMRASRIIELNQIIKPLEEEKASVENAIKLEMEDSEEGYINNKYLVKYKTITSGRVDSKKLKTSYPDIYRAVINESNSRRFEIKEIMEEVKWQQ